LGRLSGLVHISFFVILQWITFYFSLVVCLFTVGANGLAVWIVSNFEALPFQVTTTIDTRCAARISTAPAINYTAC